MSDALYVDVTVEDSENVDAVVKDLMETPGSGGGVGGTDDYSKLKNLPKINGHTLKGDLPGSDLELVDSGSFQEEIEGLNSRVDEMLPADATIPAETIDRLFSGMVARAVPRVATSVSFVDLPGLQKTVDNTLNLLDKKVNAVPGKGLSTNDFGNAEKEKLNGIAAGANKTVVDSELNAESTNPVQNAVVAQLNVALSNEIQTGLNGKASVNSPAFTGVPTAPTATQGTNTSQIATTEFVQNAIANIGTEEFELIKIVQVLPETGEPNKIYLVPISEESESNKFNEFLWVNNAWEYVGTQSLNLEGYVKATDMEEITFDDIEQMFTESSGGQDAEV